MTTMPSDQPPDRTVSLDDVLAILDSQAGAPDGYYYAQRVEQIMGWEAAVRRIREKVEALADG